MNAFFTIAIAIVAAADPSGGGVDQVWANKARSALPGLIARRLEIASHLDEVYESTATVQSGVPVGNLKTSGRGTIFYETFRRGDDLLVKSVTEPNGRNPEETLVICRNEHYNFKLTKKGRDGEYVLVSYIGDPPKGDDLQRSAHLQMLPPIRSFLKALESQNHHTVRKLVWDAGRSLVVAEYEAKPPNDPRGCFEYRTSFDPARGWIPIETVTKTWAAQFETRFEYGYEIEGTVFPSAVELKATYHVKPAPPANTTRFVIRSLGPTRSSERDFRLVAFGIPEPMDAPPLPRSVIPRYVYIFAAVVCAALALALRYFAKHRGKGTGGLPCSGLVP